MEVEADFFDFLITKFAQVIKNDPSEEERYIDFVYKIYNSNIPNSLTKISEMSIKYSNKIIESVNSGMEKEEAKNNAFKLTGLYQWVWNIDGGFNWFAGFGGGIGDRSTDGFFVNADGVVGIEYDFDFPLLISLDFRQEFGLTGDYDGSDIALSLRYQF